MNDPTLTHTIYYTHTTFDSDPLTYEWSDIDTHDLLHTYTTTGYYIDIHADSA